jgi:hypothetical protein
MPRYFFDTRDDGNIIQDDVGLEYADFRRVKEDAAKTLAEMAEYMLPGTGQRRLAVDVRDEQGRPLMTNELRFEARDIHQA